MAPYAIAHLKIGLKLYETGYRFDSAERAQVYLTNALEPPPDDFSDGTMDFLPALAREAGGGGPDQTDASALHCCDREPTVLWARLGRGMKPWIASTHAEGEEKSAGRRDLASYFEVDGEPLGERNPKWLQDDLYVKLHRACRSTCSSAHGCRSARFHHQSQLHRQPDLPWECGGRCLRSFRPDPQWSTFTETRKRGRWHPTGGRSTMSTSSTSSKGVAIGLFVKTLTQGERAGSAWTLPVCATPTSGVPEASQVSTD